MSEKDEKFSNLNQNRYDILSTIDISADNMNKKDETIKKTSTKKRRAAKSQSPSNDLVHLKSQVELLTQEVVKLREEKKHMEEKLSRIIANDIDIFSESENHDNVMDNALENQQKTDGNNIAPANFDKIFPILEVPKASSSYSQVNRAAAPKKISEKASKKLPPIFVCYNIDAKDIKNKMFSILKHKKFSFNIVNRNVTHISTSTLSDYTTIKLFLKESKINFYTFTPPEMKPYNFVIKKLSNVYDKEEVQAYISDLNLSITILNITKLSSGWLVQLSRESNIDEFKNIQYILHCKVSIESFKPSGPKQCKNCQRFTHVASNCNMPYRCVKCGESHGPNNCELPPRELNVNEVVLTDPSTGGIVKRIGMPVKCVNCGTDGHTANARICPKRIEIMKRIQEKRDKSRKSYIGLVNNGTMRTNATFASMFSNTNDCLYKENSNQNIFDSLNNDCSRIFGKNFYSCLQKVGEFSKFYVTLDNDEAKSKALFNLLVNLKLNE